MNPSRARALVEARLGRPSQDLIEAAVVLEAWGGLRAQEALAVAGRVVTAAPNDAHAGDDAEAVDEPRPLADAVVLLAALAALAAWSTPLRTGLGAAALETAVRVALPLTLALQWALGSRYLFDRRALARLAQDRRALGLIALFTAAGPAAALGRGGLAGGLLTIVWVAGPLLARRGWIVLYATLLGLTALALRLVDGASLPLLAAAAAVAAALVCLALPRGLANVYGARPWRMAFPAGVLGAAVASLLLADPSVGLAEPHALAALALVPSALASIWGGDHLAKLWVALQRDLRRLPLAEAAGTSLRGPAIRVLAGALARVLTGTLALTVVFALVAALAGARLAPVGVLAGYGLFALAVLGASLLESIARTRRAVVAVAAGVATELALRRLGVDTAGLALAAGAAVTAAAALAYAVRDLRRPVRLLALAAAL